MYYLRARYYKPDIYRFISRDPNGGNLARPMSLNPYAYCEDNPVNTVDPSGSLSFENTWYGMRITLTHADVERMRTAGTDVLLLAGGLATLVGSVVALKIVAAVSVVAGAIFVTDRLTGNGVYIIVHYKGPFATTAPVLPVFLLPRWRR